jgi:hypothetical protein
VGSNPTSTAQAGEISPVRTSMASPAVAVLVRQRSPVRSPASAGPGRDQAKTIRSWPLLVLAVPAAAEVWSGWVGIAQQTGFGTVPLLPGIWSALHLDTAVTLPVGVECYAAYALRAWLATGHAISGRTRRFARRSAICSFALGMAGQVAFHLMGQDHVTRAPWGITTLVSCLPVLVLGMGTALAHMLREDAAAADQPDDRSSGAAGERSPGWSVEDRPADQPDQHRDQNHPDQVRDQQAGIRITVRTSPSPGVLVEQLDEVVVEVRVPYLERAGVFHREARTPTEKPERAARYRASSSWWTCSSALRQGLARGHPRDERRPCDPPVHLRHVKRGSGSPQAGGL